MKTGKLTIQQVMDQKLTVLCFTTEQSAKIDYYKAQIPLCPVDSMSNVPPNLDGKLIEYDQIIFPDDKRKHPMKEGKATKSIPLYYEVIKEIPFQPFEVGDKYGLWQLPDEAHKYPEYLKPVYEEDIVEIGGHELTILTGEFGKRAQFDSLQFQKSEVKLIKLLVSDSRIRANIEILGTKITVELLNKILAKL